MNFKRALKDIYDAIEFDSHLVHTDNWQGTSIKANSQAKMCELLHESMRVDMGHRDLAKYAEEIKPNLPWADNHFLERVCGEPLNPGIEWANWPWSDSADSHRDNNGQFNHNYMERYWPKWARKTKGGILKKLFPEGDFVAPQRFPTSGIDGANYGDLGDVVKLLKSDPSTRQAYLPIWFPEDTARDKSQRKPCTLGYHFIIRNGQLDVTYFIRSCDYSRHFRDDIYLTVRLAIWILEQCGFDDIKPGKFIMHITSLHLFTGDYSLLYGVKHHEL